MCCLQDCVSKNKKAVYDLMASHGDKENLIHYTLVMKDYDEVIENSISNGQYESGTVSVLGLQYNRKTNLTIVN